MSEDLPPRDPSLHADWVTRTAARLHAEGVDLEPFIDRSVRDALARWRLDEATLWQRVRLRVRAERRSLPPTPRLAIPEG